MSFPDQAPRASRKVALVALLGAGVLFLIHAFLYQGFIVDDAFITFRYVQQWVHGNGLVYNIGERVEGYSNFLWIVLLFPFARWGLDIVEAAKGLGLLFSLLTLYLTWKTSYRLEGPKVALWLLAFSGSFAAWAMGGLETPLFTFLLLLSGTVFLGEEERGKGWVSGILWGLLTMARPEGALFALIALMFRLWRIYVHKADVRVGDLIRLTGFGSLVFPYFIWRWMYYGYPLPNTVYAKSLGLHPRALLEGSFYIYQSLEFLGGPFFVVLPVLLVLIARPLSQTVKYWMLNLAAYALFIGISGGDWMPMQRFLVHVFPPLFLVVQAGIGRLEDRVPPRYQKPVIVSLLVVQLGFLLGFSLEQRLIDRVGEGPLVPPDTPTVTYLRQHVSPSDTLAVIDAGFIAYRLPLETRIIDMVGLTDTHIAHRAVQLPGGLWGKGDAFGKWDVDYVLNQNPRFVQVNIIGETSDGEWLTNFTGTTLLVNDSRFRERYEQVREAGISGIFRRKEQ